MASSKSGHYKWLVGARKDSQDLLLCLLDYQIQNKGALRRDPSRSVFALLVGAAFSLWRAAFLSNAKRIWPKILNDANYLLDKVLKDNAITFQNELDMREWTGGFYLNNAKYRLVEASYMLKISKKSHADNNQVAFKQFEKLKQSGIENKSATESWDTLYKASREMYNLLERPTRSRKRR